MFVCLFTFALNFMIIHNDVLTSFLFDFFYCFVFNKSLSLPEHDFYDFIIILIIYLLLLFALVNCLEVLCRCTLTYWQNKQLIWIKQRYQEMFCANCKSAAIVLKCVTRFYVNVLTLEQTIICTPFTFMNFKTVV